MKNSLPFSYIHFIGILGSSMSNLALLTRKLGATVSGSDRSISNKLAILKQNDITAYVGADTSVANNADLVVYSSAVPDYDEELSYCRSIGKQCMDRSEYLGLICSLFKRVVAVSGTHGKSTVTAMIGEIFKTAGLSPAIHLGGEYENSFDFDGEYFITEACEYRESFLSISSDVAIVLNIESDHPDYYRSMEDLYSAFNKFISNLKPTGILISGDTLDLSTDQKTYKIGRDAYADKVYQHNGYLSFVPYVLGKKYPELTLSVRGEHNVTNALFALLASKLEGISPDIAVSALSSFHGVGRRFEAVKRINGAEIILDYAHHPTEIIASIKTAKLSADYVTVYFQPHTYSRTEKLFSSFLTAFDDADKVVIVEEFPARETPDMGKSARELANALYKRKKCLYVSLEKAKELLYSTTYHGETVLLLGAGNIDSIL